MKKRLIAILSILIGIILLSGCVAKQEKIDGKIKVVVSFNAMREFTQAIGGDKINIITMVPDGVEPHNFEPKVKDILEFENADVFVYNGLEMEAWVNTVFNAIDNKTLLKVDTSVGCTPIKAADKKEGVYDPHLWLSLKEAKIQASNIKDALIKADSKNKDYYTENYQEFSAKLDALYSEYSAKFKEVKNKDFVTGHAAFAYLCRDFNLEQNSVEDIFAAEGEATIGRMKELIDYCRKNEVKTIFSESLASPKDSETLAKEVGATVEKIYTVESKEDNKDYIESMKYNLDKIYLSLNN